MHVAKEFRPSDVQDREDQYPGLGWRPNALLACPNYLIFYY